MTFRTIPAEKAQHKRLDWLGEILSDGLTHPNSWWRSGGGSRRASLLRHGDRNRRYAAPATAVGATLGNLSPRRAWVRQPYPFARRLRDRYRLLVASSSARLAVTGPPLAALAAGAPGEAVRPVMLDPQGLRTGAAFGTSVAISGNVAVVGAPLQAGGVAYVYTREQGHWRQTAELRGADTRPGDFFGGAVAANSGIIVVGADAHGHDAGRAYVFTEDGRRWRQSAELSSRGPQRTGGFGVSVAVGAGTIVVGAPLPVGAIFVFTRDRRGWHQSANLRPRGARADTTFGFSVAAFGPLVVVGDPGYMGGAGRAYMFSATRHGWGQIAHLSGLDIKSGDNFGFSVAAGAGHVLVGAPWHRAGAAYVFSRAHGDWRQTGVMTGRTTRPGDQFGYSVALGPGLAVIGAPRQGAGAAYVFSPSGQGWRETAEITRPDAVHSYFGAAEAVSRTTIVSGANAYHAGVGAAWVATAAPGYFTLGR